MSLEGFISRLLEPITGWWTVPGSPFRLRKPDGFVPTDAFPGLVQPAGAGSLMVQTLPAPYGEVAPGFDREALLERGLALHGDEAVTVDGRVGRLLRCSQTATGRDYDKWILLLDADGRTVLAMATWPVEDGPELARPLREALLAARVADTDRAAKGPGFALGTTAVLRPAGTWGGMAIYTPDGRFAPGEPPEAMFLAGWGLADVRGDDARRRFATDHVGQVDDDMIGLAIARQRPVSIAGLDGFETLAEGRTRREGTERVVYETILFLEGRYAVMVGVTDAEKAETYVPAFQALVEGFRP